MKKIFCFVMIILYILGVIGGIGYTIYCGAWPIAIGIAALGWMAWPKFKELFATLNDK